MDVEGQSLSKKTHQSDCYLNLFSLFVVNLFADYFKFENGYGLEIDAVHALVW